MTYGSLFSGAGGMDFGFERAGWDCMWRVEWNPVAREVLSRTWPGVPLHGDIQMVKTADLEAVDCIAGGFPCTNLSACAFGDHAGIDGEESGLVREFGRIVRELQPRFFVVENVLGLLKAWPRVMEMGFFQGYTVEGGLLDASSFGAYTRRKRAFFVGHLGSLGGRKVLDFGHLTSSPFSSGGDKDTLPMCLPWKGGVSLERLGACLAETIPQSVPCTKTHASRGGTSNGLPE